MSIYKCKGEINMNKKFIKIISVILAFMMVTSTFTVAMAADAVTETPPPVVGTDPGKEEGVDVSDVTGAVSEFFDAFGKIFNTDFSGIKNDLLSYLSGFTDRHSKPENQWIITLNGKEMDVLSFSGFTEAVLNISTTQELKYVALSVLKALLTKFSADLLIHFLILHISRTRRSIRARTSMQVQIHSLMNLFITHSGSSVMQTQALFLQTGRQKIIILVVTLISTMVSQIKLNQSLTI